MNTARTFALEELRDATNNWDATNILGDGGFAIVFLAVIAGEGRVAIKKIRSPANKKERTFLRSSMHAEREIIMKYKHQNICELIGSFVDEQNEDAPYCLIYELCENGNVLERIACRDHKKRQVPPLTADQRLFIALGTCRALEYLHCKAVPPIVHRDIKSANILLDANLCPKVADFGTVRQDKLGDNDTHIKTMMVVGTRCYMPLEYLTGGEISVKTDSYALGIVICELLTGLNPMAKPLGQLVECALEDENLATVLDAKTEWKDTEMAVELATIAIRCSAFRKDKRATAQDVLPVLERLYNPNYMPTQLAVGGTYYDPDTGILSQGADSDGDGEGVVEDMGEPLLSKQYLGVLPDAGAERTSRLNWRWVLPLIAAVVMAAVAVALLLRHHHDPTGCDGMSRTLIRNDCVAWKQVVHRSPWFATAKPPACQQLVHLTDPCSCTDVITCDGGRIVGVDLHSRNLTFNANKQNSLSHLSGLQTLVLGTYPNPTNKLVGPVPLWLGKLGSLTHLNLRFNQLSGPIDAVTGLKALTNLSLDGHWGDVQHQMQLSGTIDALSGLTALTFLDVGSNQFSGPVHAIRGLKALTHLSFWNNRLSGPIDAVKGLKALTFLDLNNNPKLNGPITAVAGLTRLNTLNLNSDDFSGVVPKGPIDWSELDDCHLGGNHFACPLPPGAKEHCGATCPGPCTGSSANLSSSDCFAWQSYVWPSAWFTTSNPPVCQEPAQLTDPCSCTGVITCNQSSGRIVGVDLRRQGLVFNADEDDSLSHLGGLQTLMLGQCCQLLHRNNLVGPVPSWLVKLSGSLTHLGLDSNQLSGPIDVVKELTALKYLGLGQNQISGPIDAVRGLTELKYLGLGVNPKLNGTIDAVASLTKLTARYGTLYLQGGNFTGKVPAGPLNWSRVDVCGLGGNHFRCPLPPGAREHCNAACLEPCTGSSTDLSTNDCFAWQTYVRPSAYFANAIPAACQEAAHFTDPCSCTDVITCDGGRIVGVDLHSRNLTFNANKHGSLSHLRGLQTLVLGTSHHGGTNAMVGPMPSWLGKLAPTLTHLSLLFNRLSGSIDVVKGLTKLVHLDLGGNNLTGSIDAVRELTDLAFLDIGGNHPGCFSGPIDPLRGLTKLTHLGAGGTGCRINGPIDAVRELKRLTLLSLTTNELSGQIDAVKGLTALTYLDLSRNELSGPIDAVKQLTALTHLSLNDNPKLNGTIDAVAGLTRLTSLWLEGDDFSGVVPKGPIDWSELDDCHLGGNHFACPLPPGAKEHCGATCPGPCTGRSSGLATADCE
jgi:serine/threonine protein kinase